jgi:hypothetical protein
MEQMNIPDEKRVAVNYSDQTFPEAIKVLQPIVFQEEGSFCCVLGPDPQSGIFGCGDTAERALLDWNTHLQQAMVHNEEADPEVIRYVNEKLLTLSVNQGRH